MTAQIVRKVRAGAPVPDDTAYHAPIDSINAPFTFDAGPHPAPRRRTSTRLIAALLVVAAGGALFYFHH